MKVFFDSSVIIAGLKSASGGSRVTLVLAEKRKITPIVSPLVLKEVKRNVGRKFGKKELLKFASWLSKARPQIVSLFFREIAPYRRFVSAKDAHVLAGAVKAKVQFLLTLDRRHLLQLENESTLPFKVITPGELIRLL